MHKHTQKQVVHIMPRCEELKKKIIDHVKSNTRTHSHTYTRILCLKKKKKEGILLHD